MNDKREMAKTQQSRLRVLVHDAVVRSRLTYCMGEGLRTREEILRSGFSLVCETSVQEQVLEHTSGG